MEKSTDEKHTRAHLVQQSHHILDNVQKLYLNPLCADVYFSFATPQSAKVPAHKAMLAAGSDEFATIFREFRFLDI